MKRMWFILLVIFMAILPVRGQEHIFTSPITQVWPTIFTTKFEDVNRTLFIEPASITLTTETEEGKLFEKYIIQEIKEGENDLRFLCSNQAGTSLITVIIPLQKKIEIIDIYRPSPTSGETEQIRLWVN